MIDEGYIVYGPARRIGRMEDLAKRGARAIEMDVTIDSSMASAIDHIIAEEGRLDVLVNIAGFWEHSQRIDRSVRVQLRDV